MSIVLDGTTGITTPDINTTAQSTDIISTGDISAVDATLSGGVYLGGTGAANYLDDYEEGAWTPTTGGTNPTVNQATYTKIGKVVHISMYITVFSGSTGSLIYGLPFTVQAGSYVPIRYHTNTTAAVNYILRANSSGTTLYFLDFTDVAVGITAAASTFIVADFTYLTT
jgi:hypothetical protein